MLVAVHDLRSAASVRLRPGHSGQRTHRVAHPKPRAAQLGSEPRHLLHIFQPHLLESQVRIVEVSQCQDAVDR